MKKRKEKQEFLQSELTKKAEKEETEEVDPFARYRDVKDGPVEHRYTGLTAQKQKWDEQKWRQRSRMLSRSKILGNEAEHDDVDENTLMKSANSTHSSAFGADVDCGGANGASAVYETDKTVMLIGSLDGNVKQGLKVPNKKRQGPQNRTLNSSSGRSIRNHGHGHGSCREGKGTVDIYGRGQLRTKTTILTSTSTNSVTEIHTVIASPLRDSNASRLGHSLEKRQKLMTHYENLLILDGEGRKRAVIALRKEQEEKLVKQEKDGQLLTLRAVNQQTQEQRSNNNTARKKKNFSAEARVIEAQKLKALVAAREKSTGTSSVEQYKGRECYSAHPHSEHGVRLVDIPINSPQRSQMTLLQRGRDGLELFTKQNLPTEEARENTNDASRARKAAAYNPTARTVVHLLAVSPFSTPSACGDDGNERDTQVSESTSVVRSGEADGEGSRITKTKSPANGMVTPTEERWWNLPAYRRSHLPHIYK